MSHVTDYKQWEGKGAKEKAKEAEEIDDEAP